MTYKFQVMDENNENIFASVIEAYKGIIYKIARSYCSVEDDRKDLIQEILLQLWKSFAKYNPQFRYSTWVYRIALNVAISFYRKEKSRGNISHVYTDEIFKMEDYSPPDKKEDLLLLQQFINELKPLDKALMLLYLDEKSHKEISDITGISETNAATKINRIKNLLKQKFSRINH
ncbi:MAG: RNA polymerase sigma factor [Arachidicoccus sp.]|nr:RNA polymerase sigma factor [Arachidicoccus sp.]